MSTIRPPILQRDEGSAQAVLTCSLCCEIPYKGAVITATCQHVFCRACISQAMMSHRWECPNDRHSLEPGDIQPLSGALRRIWENVPVSCPLENCSWAGCIGNYVAHHEQHHRTHISVEGAGAPFVNSLYKQSGYIQDAQSYVKDWDDGECNIYIFVRVGSSEAKHWYISVVPNGCTPGTGVWDIDLYTIPQTEESLMIPPREGWSSAQEWVYCLPSRVF